MLKDRIVDIDALKNETNRKARFRTVLCFINEKNEVNYFSGIIDGNITLERRGEKGFGYDPVFMPDGYTITFAEMTPEEKNKISHRSLAVIQLLTFLFQ